MLSTPIAPSCISPLPRPRGEGRDLHLQLLQIVTDVMADDQSLAEQLRAAVTMLWLADQRTGDPRSALLARRDLQRGEEVLRQRLYRAMRGGALSRKRFDQAMALLRAGGVA